jgi:hypothetical protein
MKSFLIILFLCSATAAIAQRQYTKEWKRVDSLIEKTGLIKSAMKEVNAIYSSAKKENNDVQLIKALVYRMQLNDQLSDSGRYENISLIEKEILSAKQPAKSILHSIAGSWAVRSNRAMNSRRARHRLSSSAMSSGLRSSIAIPPSSGARCGSAAPRRPSLAWRSVASRCRTTA